MNKFDALRTRLGLAIKDARKARNVSRYLLAKKLGTQQHRVTRIENGASDMRLSTVMDIVDALGMTPGELLDPVATTIRDKGVPRNRDKGEFNNA